MRATFLTLFFLAANSELVTENTIYDIYGNPNSNVYTVQHSNQDSNLMTTEAGVSFSYNVECGCHELPAGNCYRVAWATSGIATWSRSIDKVNGCNNGCRMELSRGSETLSTIVLPGDIELKFEGVEKLIHSAPVDCSLQFNLRRVKTTNVVPVGGSISFASNYSTLTVDAGYLSLGTPIYSPSVPYEVTSDDLNITASFGITQYVGVGEGTLILSPPLNGHGATLKWTIQHFRRTYARIVIVEAPGEGAAPRPANYRIPFYDPNGYDYTPQKLKGLVIKLMQTYFSNDDSMDAASFDRGTLTIILMAAYTNKIKTLSIFDSWLPSACPASVRTNIWEALSRPPYTGNPATVVDRNKICMSESLIPPEGASFAYFLNLPYAPNNQTFAEIGLIEAMIYGEQSFFWSLPPYFLAAYTVFNPFILDPIYPSQLASVFFPDGKCDLCTTPGLGYCPQAIPVDGPSSYIYVLISLYDDIHRKEATYEAIQEYASILAQKSSLNNGFKLRIMGNDDIYEISSTLRGKEVYEATAMRYPNAEIVVIAPKPRYNVGAQLHHIGYSEPKAFVEGVVGGDWTLKFNGTHLLYN